MFFKHKKGINSHEKYGFLPLTSFSMYEQVYRKTPVIIQKKPNETKNESVDSFDTPEAIEINRARLQHIDAMGLPIEGKSVLDVGCGVGHLAQLFVKKGCDVFCVDGRKENIDSLRERYQGLRSDVADVEKARLSDYGTFDIVLCYGLLYHLENPAIALHNISSVCKELLLVETIITDHPRPILQMVDEPGINNQALSGIASRPSPSYIVMALLYSGFSNIYVPSFVPDHIDFRFTWKGDMAHWREGHPLRQVFVASRTKLENKSLISVGESN